MHPSTLGSTTAVEEDSCSDGFISSSRSQAQLEKHKNTLLNCSTTENRNLDSKNVYGERKFTLGSNTTLDGFQGVERSSDSRMSVLNQGKEGIEQTNSSYTGQRYQLGVQNGRRLARSRWQSESILEIDTSEDGVVGESGSQARSPRASYSPRSVGVMPTWSPSSLRYVKVSLNQGSFQSWPTTPRASPQSSTTYFESPSTLNPARSETPKIRFLPRDHRMGRETDLPESERGTPLGKLKSSNDERFKSESLCDQTHPSLHNVTPGRGSSKIDLDDGLQLSSMGGSHQVEVPVKKNRSQSLFDLHEQVPSADSSDRGSLQLPHTSGTNCCPEARLRSERRNDSKEDVKSQQTPHNFLSSQDSTQDIHGSPVSVGKNPAYIVRSTLCYNTSTQTDLASCTDPSIRTLKWGREVEVDNVEIRYHTSSRNSDSSGKTLHEKFVQTTGYTDVNNYGLDSRLSSPPHKYNETENDFPRISTSSPQMPPKTPTRQLTRQKSDTFINDNNYTPTNNYGHHLMRDTESVHPSMLKDTQVQTLIPDKHPSPTQVQTLIPDKHPSPPTQDHPGLESQHSNPASKSNTPKPKSRITLNRHNDQPHSILIQDGINLKTSTPGFRHDSSSAFTDFSSHAKNVKLAMTRNNTSHLYSPKEKSKTVISSKFSPSDSVSGHSETESTLHSVIATEPEIRPFSPNQNVNTRSLPRTSDLGLSSSFYSNPKSFISDRTLSYRDISVDSSHGISSYPRNTGLLPPSNSKDATYQWKKVIIVSPEDRARSRHGSDSVFIDNDSESSQGIALDSTSYSSFDSQFKRKQPNYQTINNEDEERYSGSFTQRSASGRNVEKSSKYRERGFSDSQTRKEIRGNKGTSVSGGGPDVVPESLADVISKVNENLAKSAQRVSGIRRSSSTLSRNRLDGVGTTQHDRSRRETDWTRFRSMSEAAYSLDSAHWSSRNSLGSENVFRDLSMTSSSSSSSSSSRRSSFADTRDRRFMLDGLSKNMHDVIVSSPIYQTATSINRREPPQPPQSHRPDAGPPPIPPRMNRQNQPTSGQGNRPTYQTSSKFLESSRQKAESPRERMHVIPLGKQHEEDSPGVDSSKVNFKDLINQWNSNSPVENVHSDETSKRPNRLVNKPNNGQQHHHPQRNTTPVVSYPKPIINFAATYKQEPLLWQKSLSELSTSSVPSSPTSTACSSPSSNPIPSSSKKPSHTNISEDNFWRSNPTEQHNSQTHTQDLLPSASTYSLETSPHSPSNSISNSPVIPPTSIANGTKPLPAKRAATLERPRTASSSQTISNYSSGSESQTSREDAFGRYPIFRERCSSHGDILSDKIHNSQPPQIKQHFWVPPNGIIHTDLSKQTEKDVQNIAAIRSSTSEHQIEQDITKENREEPDYAIENYQSVSAHDIQGFHDDNCMGFNNKSGHDTDKKFISSTDLQSGSNDIHKNAEDTHHTSRQESRIGQHPWSSESALFHPDSSAIKPPPGLIKNNVKTQSAKENHEITSRPTPVRPQRPTAQARRILGQTSVSSTAGTPINSWDLSSASLSDGNKSSPPKHHSHDQPSSGDHLHSPSLPKRSPPTLYPNEHALKSNLHPKEAVTSDNSLFLPDAETHEAYAHNSQQTQSPSQIQIGYKENQRDPSPQHGSGYTTPTQQNTHNSPRSSNKPANSNESPRKPKYRPRELSNLPTSGMSSSTSVEDLTRPCEDSAFPSRRKSYSSASSTTRGKSYSFTFSKRQPSMEELECDEKTKQLENELEGRDRRLLQALRQDANTKRMLYMDGLFSDSEQAGFSQNLNDRNQTLPPMTAKPWSEESGSCKSSTLPRDHQARSFNTEPGTDFGAGSGIVLDRGENEELTKHKEELIDKLRKKLVVLKGEKATLQLEIADNCMLGQQVSQAADSKCPTEYEREKFRTHLDDVEKIVRLLLNLSGQLARAESAVSVLGSDADETIKRLALDKKEKLHLKHEEAKQLKEDIDKRSGQLLVMLQGRFSEQELADYNHLIKTKSTLAIQIQEIDDQILLAENQMLALTRSLPGSGIV